MNQIGISSVEAFRLKSKFGENVLPSKEKRNWYNIIFSQFSNPLILLLFVIGMTSLYFKEILDSALIFFVIIFNVITGFIQEYSAQRTLSALKKIVKTKCFVVRDGIRQEIETKDLVPSDVVVLSSGDKIPADGKVIKGTNILINEAILTGEEEAVVKNFDSNKNNLYMGTTVVSGQGLFIVEKIGIETKIGKIGQSLSEIKEEPTPLQIRLNRLTKTLIKFVIIVCLFIFFLGILRGGDIWQTLRVSIILSIAAIPEGLPIAITVILAIGVRRILKKNGLVKKLLSIETLGSTSVICLDKTGTLTKGVMQVVKTDYKDKDKFIFALTMLNDRKVPMEIAIWKYLISESRENPEIIYNSFERVSDEPFDSAKKYKSTINKIDHHEVAYIMGASDKLINFCGCSSKEKNEVIRKYENWAQLGLRIIGVAQKDSGDLHDKKKFEWVGLVGIEDPVREEAKSALKEAQRSGIDIKIVTGDYQITAEQVAKKIGMDLNPTNIMNCDELDKITDQELGLKIVNIKLFSRVTPLQKLKIVSVLQKRGETVAMTGDGVNDAPALKKADIGIVVENGTDVAKEAADLILLDSNFKTIVAACEEGRIIFSNIKKVVSYVLSNSFAEIILILGSMLLSLPTPLIVSQILWIHLICDGPPDIMLGFEPKEKGIMDLKPGDIKRDNIFSKGTKIMIITVSTSVGLFSLGLFYYFNNVIGNIVLARTIVFTLLATVSLVYIFAFKNLNKIIVRSGNLFNNIYLDISVIYGFILILIAIYIPTFNKILNTIPLSLNHWLIILSLCLFVTLLIEISKITNTGSKV